jgi:hypothetical protein
MEKKLLNMSKIDSLCDSDCDEFVETSYVNIDSIHTLQQYAHQHHVMSKLLKMFLFLNYFFTSQTSDEITFVNFIERVKDEGKVIRRKFII